MATFGLGSMLNQPTLSTIGLVLDIVGVYLLYRYGFGGTDWAKPETNNLTWGEPIPAKGAKWAKILAPIGLALLIFGFVLQIRAQWL